MLFEFDPYSITAGGLLLAFAIGLALGVMRNRD